MPLNFSNSQPRVAAIVPAYNEAGRVADVLEAISQARTVTEIICVTDGCTDNSAEEVAKWIAHRPAGAIPAHLFALEKNLGKGGAMAHGAHRTDAEVLLFLDADLIGLLPSQVDEMLAPCLRADAPADMVLGLFGAIRGGALGWWLSWCHRATPSITGQRAIRREVFLAVPGLTRSRFGVEAAITRHVHNEKLRVAYVYLHAVTHPIKEEKLGFVRGFRNRARMYSDIFQTVAFDSARRETAASREKAMRWIERLTK